MIEYVNALNRLSEETKEIKANLQSLLKLSRIRLLKEEWIDGHDLCVALNISQRTLQYLRESGQLPFSRLNSKKYFYKYADIRALLKRNYFKKHPIKKR